MFKKFFLGLSLIVICGPAMAQSATYSGGSIYDLSPPSQQATGGGYLEALVLSKRQHRMKEIRDYAESDIYRQLARPIGRLAMNIEAPSGAQKLGYCTVSLIDDDHIITNHHCIVGNPQGRVTDALLWMGFLSTRHSKGVKQYGVELKPADADQELDYAIHKVRGKPGEAWGRIKLASNAKIFDKQSLFIIHHPAGDKQHITLGNCLTGTPAIDNDDLLHVCDTIGGSSGAPVFALMFPEPKVVGLHYRAVDIGSLNAAKRIERIVERSPLLKRLTQEVVAGGATAAPTSSRGTHSRRSQCFT